MSADSDFFLFRDFQSRNIMIHENECYFIDYQGGRRGALQYDPASLFLKPGQIFRRKPAKCCSIITSTSLVKRPGGPERIHEVLLPVRPGQDPANLGTYGLRGWVEKKALFLQSVPFGIQNIRWLLDKDHIPAAFPVS